MSADITSGVVTRAPFGASAPVRCARGSCNKRAAGGQLRHSPHGTATTVNLICSRRTLGGTMERLRTARAGVRLAAILVALASAGFALAGTPPATNQLQDIPVFKDQLLGTWSGGNIVTVGPYNDQLPIDTTQTYGGLPSLRFEVVGPELVVGLHPRRTGLDALQHRALPQQRLPRVQRQGLGRRRGVHPPGGRPRQRPHPGRDRRSPRSGARTTCGSPPTGSTSASR